MSPSNKFKEHTEIREDPLRLYRLQRKKHYQLDPFEDDGNYEDLLTSYKSYTFDITVVTEETTTTGITTLAESMVTSSSMHYYLSALEKWTIVLAAFASIILAIVFIWFVFRKNIHHRYCIWSQETNQTHKTTTTTSWWSHQSTKTKHNHNLHSKRTHHPTEKTSLTARANSKKLICSKQFNNKKQSKKQSVQAMFLSDPDGRPQSSHWSNSYPMDSDWRKLPPEQNMTAQQPQTIIPYTKITRISDNDIETRREFEEKLFNSLIGRSVIDFDEDSPINKEKLRSGPKTPPYF